MTPTTAKHRAESDVLGRPSPGGQRGLELRSDLESHNCRNVSPAEDTKTSPDLGVYRSPGGSLTGWYCQAATTSYRRPKCGRQPYFWEVNRD